MYAVFSFTFAAFRLQINIFLILYFFFFLTQYAIEVFNAGLARAACVRAAEEAMETEERGAVFVGKDVCLFDESSQPEEWAADACCNAELQVGGGSGQFCFLEYVSFHESLIFLFPLHLFFISHGFLS